MKIEKAVEILEQYEFSNNLGKAYEPFRMALDALYEKLDRQADAKGSEQKAGWIRCKDKLPEHKGLYIIYSNEYKLVDFYFFEDCFRDDITHWQPLPEPPKEGEVK